jgi:hypothetical protein
MFIFCQKNQWMTFKVAFVANRQLSAHTAPGWPAMDNFQSVI